MFLNIFNNLHTYFMFRDLLNQSPNIFHQFHKTIVFMFKKYFYAGRILYRPNTFLKIFKIKLNIDFTLFSMGTESNKI